MRKITVLKVLAIEIVNLILLKEETGVDYVVTITLVEITDFRILQHVENRPYKKVMLKTM
jgi:hypothetical protein